MNNIGYIICETASTEPQKPNVRGVINDRVEIEANLQDVEVINRNKRLYKKSEMEAELVSSRTKELLENDGFFGEAGHPLEKDLSRQQTIDPERMSHRFKSLWMDKNVVKGIVRAAATARGDDFHRTILDGTKVSFSLRALGSLEIENGIAVVRNLKTITWDWVVYPSHVIAYMNKIVNNPVQESAGILSESSNFILKENDRGLLVPITNSSVEKFIQEKSDNIKYVMEALDFMYNKIELSKDGHRVLLHSDEEVITINLESFVQNKLMDFCSSL